jgi:hypothetical protein
MACMATPKPHNVQGGVAFRASVDVAARGGRDYAFRQPQTGDAL